MHVSPKLKSLLTQIRNSRVVKKILPPTEIGGLEISEDSIRFALLESKNGSLEWKYFSSRPLPAGVVTTENAPDPTTLSIHIRLLFDSIVTNEKLSRSVIITIPDSHLYIQNLTIPLAAAEDLVPSVIINNPNVLFPYPLEQSYLAWQEVFTKKLEKRIVAAFAKKEVIDAYLASCEIAGLRPLAMQTPSIGFEFFMTFKEGVTILYFFEKAVFTTAVYLNGKLFYKSTALLSARIGKPTFGIPEVADFIAKDLLRVKDFMLSEIEADQKVFLSIISYDGKIDRELREQLKQRNIEVTDVFVRPMNIPKNLDNASSWLPALGAAARGLLPRKDDKYASVSPFSPKALYLKERKENFFTRTRNVVFTTLTFYLLCFVLLGVFVSSIQKKTNATLLQQESVQLPEELVAIEAEMNKFNRVIARVNDIKGNLRSILPTLKTIKNLTFQGVSFTSFQTVQMPDKINVTIAGTATTRDNFLAFKKHLEELKEVKEVTVPVQNLEQRENINFSITYAYHGF